METTDDQEDDDDRLRLFSPLPQAFALYCLGPLLTGGVAVGLIFFGNSRLFSWPEIFFLMPAAGCGLAVLYVNSAKVTVDQDGVTKSSLYGSTYFPFSEITDVIWRTVKGDCLLQISAGHHSFRCSTSLFGKPQLEGMRASILARVPHGAATEPPPVAMSTGQMIEAVSGMYGMGALALLAILGFNVRFAPDELGRTVLQGGAVLIGLAGASWMISLARPKKMSPATGIRQSSSQTWATALLLALILGFGCGAVSLGGLTLFASLYTRLTGVPARQVVTVSGLSRGYRSCSQFKLQEIHSAGRAFCADYDYMLRHPVGSKLVIRGVRSNLGLNFDPIQESNP